jgi:hypothetical protein
MNDQVLGRLHGRPRLQAYALPIPPALAASAGVGHAGAAQARDQHVGGRARCSACRITAISGVMVDRVDVR